MYRTELKKLAPNTFFRMTAANQNRIFKTIETLGNDLPQCFIDQNVVDGKLVDNFDVRWPIDKAEENWLVDVLNQSDIEKILRGEGVRPFKFQKFIQK